MSWQFSDDTDRTLFIQPIAKSVGAFIHTNGGEVVEVKPEQAVGIAGNLLAFSRAEATVVPGKLPEAKIVEAWKDNWVATVPDEHGYGPQWAVSLDSIENARRYARDLLAIANHIEEYLDSEEHANKMLQERRDAIAVSLGTSELGYRDTFDSTQRAIDRIIELEDKLGEAK